MKNNFYLLIIFATLIYSHTTFTSAKAANSDPLLKHSLAEYIPLFDQSDDSRIECLNLDKDRCRINNFNLWLQDTGIVPRVGFGTFRQDGTQF
jgi:hypothetical protein